MFLLTRVSNMLQGKIFSPALRYYLKRDEFYDAHSYMLNPRRMLESYDVKVDHVAQNPIQFKGLNWGCSVKDAITTLGYPKFIRHKDFYGQEHTILFYREDIGGFGVVTQMHFIGPEFLFASYLFIESQPQELNRIFSGIKKKYLGEEAAVDYSVDLHIKDKGNNIISFEHNIYPVVLYLDGRPETRAIFQKVEDDAIADRKQEEEDQMNDLISNL